jgi:hypothetical protein
MYTIPGDPVRYRRQQRKRRHRLRVQAQTVIQLLMIASVLLTAAAQGALR